MKRALLFVVAAALASYLLLARSTALRTERFVGGSRGAAVFVGGANTTANQDMFVAPDQWRTVAAAAGLWAHPMGVGQYLMNGTLRQYLSRFALKRFVYEMDLLAWSDGSNPTQTNTPSCWGDWIMEADPAFACEFYAPWVDGDLLATNTELCTRLYAQIRTRMDAQPRYRGLGAFFTAPPSPMSIRHVDALIQGRQVEAVVRGAGLNGIAVDYPADLWLSGEFGPEFPAGSAAKCRIYMQNLFGLARRLGVKFAWVFNGDHGELVARALTDARTRWSIVPDYVCIDNFTQTNQIRGVPESNPATLAGQGLTALRWMAANNPVPLLKPKPKPKLKRKLKRKR